MLLAAVLAVAEVDQEAFEPLRRGGFAIPALGGTGYCLLHPVLALGFGLGLVLMPVLVLAPVPVPVQVQVQGPD